MFPLLLTVCNIPRVKEPSDMKLTGVKLFSNHCYMYILIHNIVSFGVDKTLFVK